MGTLWDPYSQMHSKVKYTISVYQHTWFRTGILIGYLDYTWYLTNRFSGIRMVTSGIRYDMSGIRIEFYRYQVSEFRYQVPTQVSEFWKPGISHTCTCTVSNPGTGIPGTCIYTYTWFCSTHTLPVHPPDYAALQRRRYHKPHRPALWLQETKQNKKLWNEFPW